MPAQWSTKPRKPMKRTPIRRARPTVAQNDPAIFEIVTQAGDRYLWPIKHMPEEGSEGWRATVEGWALLGDRHVKIWHAQTSETTRSDKGWFDDAIFQPTRGYYVLTELKVRDRLGVANQPSKDQWEYISAGIACGLNVTVWTYPDDAREAYEALTGYSYDAWLRGRVEL